MCSGIFLGGVCGNQYVLRDTLRASKLLRYKLLLDGIFFYLGCLTVEGLSFNSSSASRPSY